MEDIGLLRGLLSLAFVVGLVLAMGWVLRRWDMSKLAGKMQQGRRLQLREQLYLDARRKAVILRCDEKEYLVVLGAQGEQFMELSVASRQSSVNRELGEAE